MTVTEQRTKIFQQAMDCIEWLADSYRECAETWEKLSEAKELLQKLVDISEKTYPDDNAFDVDFEELLRETEQFLNQKEEENKGNE